MITPIAPGDWVECVAVDRMQTITIGQVYRVSALGSAPEGYGCWRCEREEDAVYLASVPQLKRGYCTCHFRPIYRPKSSFIESLTVPSDDLVSTPTKEGVVA